MIDKLFPRIFSRIDTDQAVYYFYISLKRLKENTGVCFEDMKHPGGSSVTVHFYDISKFSHFSKYDLRNLLLYLRSEVGNTWFQMAFIQIQDAQIELKSVW